MGTINSDGIFIYDDTESLSPLSSYMNLQGSALSTRLAQDVRFKKVANEAARTAYVNEVGIANISAANPLAVHRQNAPEGLRFEVTYNGTTWRTLADKGYYDSQDTGWVSLPLAAGFTGLARYRRVGVAVQVDYNVSGAFPAATWTNALVSALPTSVRPTTNVWGANYMVPTSGPLQDALSFITPTGVLTHRPAVAATSIQSTHMYFIG